MAAKQFLLRTSYGFLLNGRKVCWCKKLPLNQSAFLQNVKGIQGTPSNARSFFTGNTFRVAFYYQVTVETGDCFAGGTDANVFIKLIGERGISDEIHLPTKKGDMERGMKNTYEITADDVGPLKRVFVRHDNSGIGPAWFLKKITVQSRTREKFVFNCNDWLRVSKSKGKLGLVKSMLEDNLKSALGREAAEKIENDTTFDEYTAVTEKKVHEKLERILSEVSGSSASTKNGISSNILTPKASGDKPGDTQDKDRGAITAKKATKPKDTTPKSKQDGINSKSVSQGGKTVKPVFGNDGTRHLTTQSSFFEVPLSPAVRFLLETHGLERQSINPTGPKGRILKGDVLSFIKFGPKNVPITVTPTIEAKPTVKSTKKTMLQEVTIPTLASEEGFLDIPNSDVRKTMAERLTEAKMSIPHSYVTSDCNVTKIQDIRQELKADGITLTLNDFIVKAVALALRKVPQMNSQWDGERAVCMESVDISIAVSTSEGLVTPIIKNADHLDLTGLAASIQLLSQKACDGELQPNEYHGGTFTISNLGMFGLSHFSAIVNPPQTSIMAVGGTKLSLAEEGTVKSHLTVTLSYDSRALTEETASSFLDVFKTNMENPYTYLTS